MTPHRLSFTSDWKQAAACPAAWHAQRVAHAYTPPRKECYATGSLFHAALLTPDRVPAVYAEYPEFLTLQKAGKTGAKGEPNGEARKFLAAAAYCRQLPEVAAYLEGARCETEVCWELDGIPWVSHIDWLTDPGDTGTAIIDAKTCKKIGGWEWIEAQGCKRPWHEASLYWWQLACYRRALAPQPVGAVGILGVQVRTDDAPLVDWPVLPESDHDLLDQYARDIEASMRSEWTSPLTGRKVPSFAAMLAKADSNCLPRCGDIEECAWCDQTRPSVIRVHALPRGRGV